MNPELKGSSVAPALVRPEGATLRRGVGAPFEGARVRPLPGVAALVASEGALLGESGVAELEVALVGTLTRVGALVHNEVG